MNEWQERVVQERDDLAQKFQDLESYLSVQPTKAIPDDSERIDLISQRNIMRIYLNILERRISKF